MADYCTDEEIKLSLTEAHDRWDYRKKMSFRIGQPKYAMAQYGKINRITLPIGDEGIMLVTTELGINIDDLVDKLVEIRNGYFC